MVWLVSVAYMYVYPAFDVAVVKPVQIQESNAVRNELSHKAVVGLWLVLSGKLIRQCFILFFQDTQSYCSRVRKFALANRFICYKRFEGVFGFR